MTRTHPDTHRDAGDAGASSIRALETLAKRVASSELDGASARAALVTIGHALHAGLELPPSLAGWLAERSLRELAELVAEAGALEPQDAVAAATAVLRATIARAVAPAEVAGLPALLERTREARALASDDGVEPDDVATAEYVEHGTLARWVEQWAARDQRYREELATVIAVAREMHEGVSLVARRWERAQRGERGAIVLPVEGHLAAAPAQAELAPRFVWLGRLAPLDCTARLVIAGDVLELRVDELSDALSAVELGGAAGARDESGVWSVRVPVPRGPFSIVVRARDGRSFEDELGLELAEPQDEA